MPYPEDMVAPMRAEAVAAGAKEVRTADDVRAALAERAGTTLFFINSVCGCSAASARPGLTASLHGAKKAPRVYTAFAGNDTTAVDEIRKLMVGFPPSSPSMALLKDGDLVAVIERHDIQGATADQVAAKLTSLYAQHC